MKKVIVKKNKATKVAPAKKKVAPTPVVITVTPESIAPAPVVEKPALPVEEIMFMKSYHGGRETQRAVDAPTGGLLGAGIVARVLTQAGLRFTEAEARDGTIIRVFNGSAGEEFRFFLSKQAKWSGMFGVSGKARDLIEHAIPGEYLWKRQSPSANYYFSHNMAGLMKFLGA